MFAMYALILSIYMVQTINIISHCIGWHFFHFLSFPFAAFRVCVHLISSLLSSYIISSLFSLSFHFLNLFLFSASHIIPLFSSHFSLLISFLSSLLFSSSTSLLFRFSHLFLNQI